MRLQNSVVADRAVDFWDYESIIGGMGQLLRRYNYLCDRSKSGTILEFEAVEYTVLKIRLAKIGEGLSPSGM